MVEEERGVKIRPEISVPESRTSNDSLSEYILDLRGFDTLDQAISDKSERRIPLWVGKDIVLTDSVEANLDLKLKLLAYRLWSHRANLDPVKRFIPEDKVRIEDFGGIISEAMDEKGKTGKSLEKMADIDEVIEILEARNISFNIHEYKTLIGLISNLIAEGRSIESIKDDPGEILSVVFGQKERPSRLIVWKLRRPRSIEEDPKLETVEELFNKGYKQKEIATKTGFTFRQVRNCLSALRIEGRIKTTKWNEAKTAELRKLAEKVEKLINESGDERYSYKKLAETTSSTASQIKHVLRMLYLLGRARPQSKKEIAQRSEDIKENEVLVEGALELYSRFFPGRRISYEIIRRLIDKDLSDDTLFKYYAINKKKGKKTPYLKGNSLEGAKEALRVEVEANHGEPIVYKKLAKKYGYSKRTIVSAHSEIKNELPFLISISEYRTLKKKQFFNVLENAMANGIWENITASRVAKKLGINRRTASGWFRDFLKMHTEVSLNGVEI